MMGSHRWQKSREKIVILSRVRETHFEVSDHPRAVPMEHHGVEYKHPRVADINLKIGW